MTANLCDSLNNTLHPAFVYPFSKRCYKSVRLQFPMCKFPAVMLLSFKPVLLRRWERRGSSVEEDSLSLLMCPWALSRLRRRPGSHRSPSSLRFSWSLPVCASLQSLFSEGYLIRPSLFTGPISDLGSGDKELQAVFEQDPKAGHEEVCVAHKSPITQKDSTEVSTHASRAWPTNWELRWATCIAGSWGGSLSTELSCWKLCSRYKFPGGPAWSQLSSSRTEGKKNQKKMTWVSEKSTKIFRF